MTREYDNDAVASDVIVTPDVTVTPDVIAASSPVTSDVVVTSDVIAASCDLFVTSPPPVRSGRDLDDGAVMQSERYDVEMAGAPAERAADDDGAIGDAALC